MPPQGKEPYCIDEEPGLQQTDKDYIVAEKGIKWRVAWMNAIILPVLHMAAIYGLYVGVTQMKWKAWIFGCIYGPCSGLGITAGSHRLWSHRSYKAKWPLRLLLIIFHSIAFEGPVYSWARDHRIHHRYSETNADPHNAKRGFFFAHVGWLMLRKHPDIKANAHKIDLSDLHADPFVMFQKKNYILLVVIFSIILPVYIGTLLGESLWVSFFCLGIYRYVLAMNCSWLVNSAAHIFGNKPYDKNINPAENNFVSYMALGEGFHNYHHTFPWDYKTAELGGYSLNVTKAFIDFMAMIGWAYDLKTVPPQMILERKKRTGDGSHDVNNLESKMTM